MQPLILPPNVIDHFYRGGARIGELRGFEPNNEFQPEEWLAACTSRAGAGEIGLSRTTDGLLLRDIIAADRLSWIGTAAAPYGAGDNGLLVKLLDAGQRLPVHVHPGREFAASHLGCPYGKTEAWFVLAVDPSAAADDQLAGDGPAVWLGWTEDVDPAEVSARVEAQDSTWMLSRMHRIPVRPGDGILVPAGSAHAIGAGVFVAEVQEPTDQSILLEWSITTSGREDSHLDLGFPTALQALNHHKFDADQVASLCRHSDLAGRGRDLLPLLPAAADNFFRLDMAAPTAAESIAVPAGFAVVVVLDGAGVLTGQVETVPVSRGQVLAVPHAFGSWQVGGDVQLLVCRPGLGWPETMVAP